MVGDLEENEEEGDVETQREMKKHPVPIYRVEREGDRGKIHKGALGENADREEEKNMERDKQEKI